MRARLWPIRRALAASVMTTLIVATGPIAATGASVVSTRIGSVSPAVGRPGPGNHELHPPFYAISHGISCPAPNECMAVGLYDTGNSTTSLAQWWNGASWRHLSTPFPPGRPVNPQLQSVSCISAAACVAVGGYNGNQGELKVFAEAWNGKDWVEHSMPLPARSTYAVSTSVSCSSFSGCVAVGSYEPSNTSGIIALAEVWNGRSWAMTRSPTFMGGAISFQSVSCKLASFCMAVGSSGGQVVAASWNGRTWTVLSVPHPQTAYSSTLWSVSCTSAATCSAVGWYGVGMFSSVTHSVVVSWNGQRWAIVGSPDAPRAPHTVLYSVSCASLTACMAVGYYSPNGGGTFALVEAWNGKEWSIRPAPPLATRLADVDCPSAASCVATAESIPSATSFFNASVIARWDGATWTVLSPAPIVAIASTPDGKGYYLASSDGVVFVFGDARTYGDLNETAHVTPVVGIDPTPDGRGYWLVSAGGGVFPYGDAKSFGSEAGHHLSRPIVGMAATRDGRGYWLVASDGGLFSFGDATFRGSMGGRHLNDPIVGMALDAVTGGYWMVAADGGIFAFDARFFGSTGSLRLKKPIIEIEALVSARGYRFVASDGGVFDFGAARFAGSLGGKKLSSPVSGMAPQPGGTGYWLVQVNGTVTAFGGAHTYPPG